jgi:uncharacterized protein YkwD
MTQQKNKNDWKLLRCILSKCKTLHVTLCLVIAMMATGLPAHARDTYGQYAQKLLSNPPDGANIRTDLEAKVLNATNSYRASQGLPALKPASKTLLFVARAHAMDLLVNASMGHTASTGHGFESRIRALSGGQMALAAMAENAARVRNSSLSEDQRASRLVQMWVGSSGHRKNLVNKSYTAIAIGVAVRGDDVYAVQVFTGPTVKTNMWGKRTPVN